jgi:hypothetical protein
MKSNLMILSLLVAFTLMASFGFAGTAAMRVTIPFDFYAGSQQLPAGDYTFQIGSSLVPTASQVTVRTQKGAGICVLLTNSGTDAGSGKLLFNKYGNKHFLSSISIHGFKAGVPTQKLEKELKAQSQDQPGIVTIAQN